jgi:hypothetical protein
MVPSPAEIPDLTIVVKRTTDTKEICAAAAVFGSESTTLCFFDFLETEDDIVDGFLREVRVFATADTRSPKMSQTELKSRLSQWMKVDRPRLPIVATSRRDDAYPVKGVDISQLRQLPIPLIERIAFQQAGMVYDRDDFIGPSNLQIKTVARHPELLDFASERSLVAHLTQLQAVEYYLEAATEGSLTPLLHVQKNLKVPANTARNLIQRARENGYLTNARSGKAIGKATKKARDLVSRVEKTVIKIRKEELR